MTLKQLLSKTVRRSAVTSLTGGKEAERVSEWVESKVWTDPYRTLEQEASGMGLTVQQMTSYFRIRFGESFVMFRVRLRVQEAQVRMRLYPELTMQQIGEMCGFQDRRNFEKHFAKLVGERPAQWKKRFVKV